MASHAFPHPLRRQYLITTYGAPLVCSPYTLFDGTKSMYEGMSACRVRHGHCSLCPSAQSHAEIFLLPGETALHLAIVKQNFNIVKLLVQHGADVNAEATGASALDGTRQRASLRCARRADDAVVIQSPRPSLFLRPPSGDFFDQDEAVDKGIYFGSTPLMFAVCSHQLGTVEYLLNKGANPGIQVGNHRCRMMHPTADARRCLTSGPPSFAGPLRQYRPSLVRVVRAQRHV